MTQALIGVWYKKKVKVPCYLYVQDLWPENVESVAGIKNKFVLNLIGKMVDYIYSNLSSNINCIDVYDTMAENKNEYIFYRTEFSSRRIHAFVYKNRNQSSRNVC